MNSNSHSHFEMSKSITPLRLTCIHKNANKMQISKENKSHQLSVWLLQIDRVKISGRNLDKLNECSLAGGSGKQEKKLFHLPV